MLTSPYSSRDGYLYIRKGSSYIPISIGPILYSIGNRFLTSKQIKKIEKDSKDKNKNPLEKGVEGSQPSIS